MRVIDVQDGLLNVDLAQIEEENDYTVSMKDSMMTTPRPSSVKMKFKPKYRPLDLHLNPLKFAVVLITKAAQPSFVYIQIKDEDQHRYRLMQEQLQLEFSTATKHSASYSPFPVVGMLFAD